MANTTIEDVLNKYKINDGRAAIVYFEDAVKAMQEWASLQTPSNEKYGWVKALERLPSKHDVVCVRNF